ncbi:MAG: pantoate kinase [Methanomethylophilus sp.]|jgi:pantoate kinase
MKVSAFCPGHITFIFRPCVDSRQSDLLKMGSMGAGVRISLGAEAVLEEIDDCSRTITVDGAEGDFPVSRAVLNRMLPDRGLKLTVKNAVPTGQGFGMSAAGAIAAALCAAEIKGENMNAAYVSAHIAEIVGGGGLGDVSALTCPADVPVRVKPGLPPHGEVVGTDIKLPHLALAVLGPKMNTGKVLGNVTNFMRITAAGTKGMEDFMADPTEERLFSISNEFSKGTGIEAPEVSDALAKLSQKGIRAAMCMLGNSIAAECSADELRGVIGDVPVWECSSTPAVPGVTRKG